MFSSSVPQRQCSPGAGSPGTVSANSPSQVPGSQHELHHPPQVPMKPPNGGIPNGLPIPSNLATLTAQASPSTAAPSPSSPTSSHLSASPLSAHQEQQKHHQKQQHPRQPGGMLSGSPLNGSPKLCLGQFGPVSPAPAPCQNLNRQSEAFPSALPSANSNLNSSSEQVKSLSRNCGPSDDVMSLRAHNISQALNRNVSQALNHSICMSAQLHQRKESNSSAMSVQQSAHEGHHFLNCNSNTTSAATLATVSAASATVAAAPVCSASSGDSAGGIQVGDHWIVNQVLELSAKVVELQEWKVR